MCKHRFTTFKLPASVAVATVVGLLAGLIPTERAQAQCAPGIGAVTILGLPPSGKVRIGDTINIIAVSAGNQVSSLATTNGELHLIFPDNVEHTVAEDLFIGPGQLCSLLGVPGAVANFACPASAGLNIGNVSGTCLVFPTTYVVAAADIGNALDFSDSHGGFVISATSPSNPYHVQFMEVAAGLALNANGTINTGGAAAATPVQAVPVYTPCISITKECDSPCTPYGQPIAFHGTVSNTGDTPLTGVTVTDTPPPGSVSSAITFDNVQPSNRAWDGTLAPGESAVYHGTYTPPNTGGSSLCGPFTDTISATAVDINGNTISNTDPCWSTSNGIDYTSTGPRPPVTATCHVSTSPALTLTKTCGPSPINAGQSYSETFVVCNTGNVPLTGVVIQDSKLGPIAVGILQPGECQTINMGPFTTTAADCPSVTDRAVATGNNICPPDATCPAPPTVSSAEVTCTVIVNCPPECEVTKEVACYLPGNTCGPFGPVATGVKDGACPAFCYRITVRNTSTTVPIATLSVNDPDLGGDISSLFGPLPIAPGDTRTAEIKPVTHCEDTPNTVTVVCGSATGQTDTDTADALARVLDINIECSLALFSSFELDGNNTDNHVTLPNGSVDTPVTVTLTLRNTGSSPLNVTSVAGLPALVDCADDVTPIDVNAVLGLPLTIPAGGEVETTLGCWLVSCPGGSISATAHAEADDANGTLCVYDSSGNIVDDDSPECPASVTCETVVSCRTTGGGELLPGGTDESCITVNTTIIPSQTANGLVIKKITHGGQLGAPFAQEGCVELGNPCIRGQWQHVRHYVGTANPRDVIDMNFHSVTPKGVFDSLNCACLGCCDPETGAFITPIELNGLCNPDDHKICGPQPRPAPANAIIFSGIGRMTPEDDVRGSRAALAEWVVFRVYIEDRSEPGGFHPNGAVEPADVYVFQAWKTGIKVTRKPDFTTVAPAFRTALGQANCDFLNALAGGALPIGTLPSPEVNGVTADIQDSGPLANGNRQIHPSTAATCD